MCLQNSQLLSALICGVLKSGFVTVPMLTRILKSVKIMKSVSWLSSILPDQDFEVCQDYEVGEPVKLVIIANSVGKGLEESHLPRLQTAVDCVL